jgi:hypothetical protein
MPASANSPTRKSGYPATRPSRVEDRAVADHTFTFLSGGPYGENLASSYGYSDPIGTGLTGWENEACESLVIRFGFVADLLSPV